MAYTTNSYTSCLQDYNQAHSLTWIAEEHNGSRVHISGQYTKVAINHGIIHCNVCQKSVGDRRGQTHALYTQKHTHGNMHTHAI